MWRVLFFLGVIFGTFGGWAAEPLLPAQPPLFSGDLYRLVNDEGEGYCTDGANHYVMFRTHLLKIAADAAFASGGITLLASNMNTVAQLTGCNHCGGIKYHDGLIYCAAENYQAVGQYAQQSVALYDATDCHFVASHPISAGRNEASGLAIIPQAGKHGLIVVTSYDIASAPEARELGLFDLQSFQFLGYLVMNHPLPYMQDVCYNPGDDRLYVAASGPNIIAVTLDGTVREPVHVFDDPKGTYEGLDIWRQTNVIIEVNSPAAMPGGAVLRSISLAGQTNRNTSETMRRRKVKVKITPPL